MPATMIRYELIVMEKAKDAQNLTNNGTVLNTDVIKNGAREPIN